MCLRYFCVALHASQPALSLVRRAAGAGGGGARIRARHAQHPSGAAAGVRRQGPVRRARALRGHRVRRALVGAQRALCGRRLRHGAHPGAARGPRAAHRHARAPRRARARPGARPQAGPMCLLCTAFCGSRRDAWRPCRPAWSSAGGWTLLEAVCTPFSHATSLLLPPPL